MIPIFIYSSFSSLFIFIAQWNICLTFEVLMCCSAHSFDLFLAFVEFEKSILITLQRIEIRDAALWTNRNIYLFWLIHTWHSILLLFLLSFGKSMAPHLFLFFVLLYSQPADCWLNLDMAQCKYNKFCIYFVF